jgi:hypothetical protein
LFNRNRLQQDFAWLWVSQQEAGGKTSAGFLPLWLDPALFVIDYLPLLNSTSRRAQNRQQEIADIAQILRD